MDIELKKQFVLTIRSLYFSINDQWATFDKTLGISSSQQHILYILSTSKEALSISDISNLGCWHLSTASRLIQSLVKGNYVSITVRRNVRYVKLTDLGRGRLAEIVERAMNEEQFPFQFTKMKREDLETFIQKGLEILKKDKGQEFINWVQTSKV